MKASPSTVDRLPDVVVDDRSDFDVDVTASIGPAG